MMFSVRSHQSEIMDDLSYSGETIYQTLRELDFINQWLGGNQVTFSALTKVFKEIPVEQTVSIVDLGCGSGEMLRLIEQRFKNRNLQLFGIDANEHVIHFARRQSSLKTQYEALNIFSSSFQSRRFDIVLASLFLHHFTNEQLVDIFSSLKKQAKVAIIINDIHRYPLAYYSIKWLTQIFSKSSMVKYDAPLSVLRAFKKNEIELLLQKADIKNYELKWKWAFRWQLIIHTRLTNF